MGSLDESSGVVAVHAMKRLIVAAWIAGAAGFAAEEGEPRFSLPTADERALWKEPGFRLQLGWAYGWLEGLDGAPSGRLMGPVLRVGVRLDDRWSMLGSFQYLAASADGGLSALRYSGTLEPTWHVSEQLSLAAGIGFGGIVEGQTSRSNPEPQPSTLNSSYTFLDAQTPLPRCGGSGVAGLFRIDWTMALGPRSRAGVALEALAQWTQCSDNTGRVEPDTAEPIVRYQYWPHVGGMLAWVLGWR